MKALPHLLIMIFLCIQGYGQNTDNLFSVNNENAIPFLKSSFRTAARTQIPVISSRVDSLILLANAEINSDSLENYLLELQGMGTRFMLAPNHRDVAVWLKNKFISLGCQNVELDSFQCVAYYPFGTSTPVSTWQYNVVATLTGTVNTETVNILGGHYDNFAFGGDPYTGVPGADDNATAVATCLEIARVFNKVGFRPASTVKFIGYAAEELGLFGSLFYAQRANILGEHINKVLNNDMIAYCPDTSFWKLKANRYPSSGPLCDLGVNIISAYTSLTPVVPDIPSFSTDSYAFLINGFHATTFDEFLEPNPYLHTLNDSVSHCNIPFFTEAVKVSCGMLVHAAETPEFVEFMLKNPGTGHSLVASWAPGSDQNIASYKIYVGKASGVYDRQFITTDTSFIVDDLMKDSTYYVAVSAINTNGEEGLTTEQSDAPALVTLDKGILIVRDSHGGFLNPADSTIDHFYTGLCEGFRNESFDATSSLKVTLSDLGPYQAVIWHSEVYNNNSTFLFSQGEIGKYLALGGKLLFTLQQPGKFMGATTSYPVIFHDASFPYLFPKIQETDLKPGAAFNGAIPVNGYPSLAVDSLKVPANYHGNLISIESLLPNSEGSVIYKYGTSYDTTSPQGSMKNMPVGIEYLGADFSAITLSFPLYYMKTEEAKEFVKYAMRERFNVFPIGIEESIAREDENLFILPNPVHSNCIISIRLKSETHVLLKIRNVLGQEVATLKNGILPEGTFRIPFDGSGLPGGIYVCELQTGSGKRVKLLMKGE